MKGFLLLSLIIGFTGCASFQRMVTRTGINVGIAPGVSHMIEAIKETKSGRLVEKGLADHLLIVTGMVEITEGNFRLLNEAAFLYCAYGIFMEEKEPEFAKELFDIGKDFGLRALKQNRKFRKGLAAGKKIPELVGHLDEDYVKPLLWTGLNIGLWIVHNMDDPAALMGMADAMALVERSIELDEKFYHGAGKMFLASYYALTPEYLGLGGGPENSRQMFEQSRAVENGNFLLVDVLEARFLATITENEDRYDELLNGVIEKEPDDIKGIRLINELAKMKAQYYLSHKSDYF
ncbi:MAG: hypothetical protein OMM_12246 [Candidatus Magnetoglobus multicellularis str. Araruama]|uniref:TRAP transporter T-component n=1 Tax=Candidatus Magnetoglobus multicellularis str. Araruama TaxID=890399 RepID=A0A1V1NWE2_9BACT|nr:MAG: hypothetical protein OMM_12246 [Candidatus Magnetoglobus multicellularis str. Araruama]